MIFFQIKFASFLTNEQPSKNLAYRDSDEDTEQVKVKVKHYIYPCMFLHLEAKKLVSQEADGAHILPPLSISVTFNQYLKLIKATERREVKRRMCGRTGDQTRDL